MNFLHSLLPLFQVTATTPRAEIEVVRANTPKRAIDYLFFGDVDLVHIASHGSEDALQVGSQLPRSLARSTELFSSSVLYPEHLEVAALSRGEIGAVVINTSCEMATDRWVQAFMDAGAVAYIAAKRSLLAKDAAIFASAFYSAYFGTIHTTKAPPQRAFDAYRLALAAYASFVPNASRSKFYWHSNSKVKGRTYLSPISLA
ncbi:MAG: hypothetical protein ACYCTI_00340 [Acidimicrobiales bacterium]